MPLNTIFQRTEHMPLGTQVEVVNFGGGYVVYGLIAEIVKVEITPTGLPRYTIHFFKSDRELVKWGWELEEKWRPTIS